MFVLCRKCGEEKTSLCNHSDKERAVCGVWCLVELRKALEVGYRLLKVFPKPVIPSRLWFPVAIS